MYHAAGDTNARSYIWYEKPRANIQRGNELLGLAGPRDSSDMTIAALQPGQGHMKQGNIQSSVNEVTHEVRRNSQVHMLTMLEHHSRQGIDNPRALASHSFCSRRCFADYPLTKPTGMRGVECIYVPAVFSVQISLFI